MEGEIEVTHPIRWTVVSQSEVRNVSVMEGEIEVTHPIRWSVVSKSEVRNGRVVERDGRKTPDKMDSGQ